MVAPNYTQQCKELSLKIGLGRKALTKVAAKPAGKTRAKKAEPATVE